MTAKEYQSQARWSDAKLDALRERIQRYRDLATRRTAVYRSMPGGGTRNTSSVEEYTLKIVDLEREIVERVDAYADTIREIEGVIDDVADDRYRTLLRLRYLSGWSWRRIARRMNYAEQYIFVLHGEALMQVKVPEKYR